MARSDLHSDVGGKSLREPVQRILDLMRPAVQADGGDLELVEVTVGGVVRIDFLSPVKILSMRVIDIEEMAVSM